MLSLSPILVLLLVFISILVLLLAGLEIGFTLIFVGVVSLILFPSRPLIQQAAEVGWAQLNSFTLTAMPLFVFMGQILSRSGISELLYRATEKWLHRLPGSLANANVASCAIFAALSGSSLATCASIGSIAVPSMDARGYNRRLTLGSLAAGGTLGILIPPSIGMILYGYLANVSIGKLFMAGIIPGVALALAFMLTIVIWTIKDPSICPHLETPPSWKEKFISLLGALPSVALIVVVLGSIYAGIATPTEAAALGAFGALIIALIHKKLSWNMLTESLSQTVCTTAMVGLIIAGSSIIAWVLHALQIPTAISEAIVGSGMNRYLAFTCIIVLLYVLGCFIEGVSVLLIMTPILTPIMAALDFNLIWFGVVFILTSEVSLITPPVGMNLFVLQGVVPDSKMSDLVMGSLPYVFILTIAIIVFTIWPGIITWLPNALL